MKTLRESILDADIIDRTEETTQKMLDWYDRWDKFDKDFWKIFPIEAHRAGVDKHNFANVAITDRTGFRSKLKYDRMNVSGSCKDTALLRKIWIDTIRALYKKHFHLNAKFLGSSDIMHWVMDDPPIKQGNAGAKLKFGSLRTFSGYYTLTMKKYKL